MADLSTLVQDIYKLFDEDEHHEPSPENLEALGRGVMDIVKRRLSKRDDEREVLRFSSLGKPDRQLWYQANLKDNLEKMRAQTLFKFLYGDVIEQLLLFLAKEAGHEVTDEQLEIEVDGVKGHIDAVIDGIVVDVKSASPYSFKKFATGTLREDDPFGYIGQISGYSSEVSPQKGGAFLAADKVHGSIALLSVDSDTVQSYGTRSRISHLKEVIKQKDPPPRCYTPVPEGKSGNMKLGINCSYCPFKEECWKDSNGGRGLRRFIYASGPVWLTHVEKEPKVQEDF